MASGVPPTSLRLLQGIVSPTACAQVLDACTALPLRFERGRQGTGYKKADLLNETVPIIVNVVGRLRRLLGDPPAVDAWWLVYPPGSHIPTHTDPPLAAGLAHLRVNVLIERGVGGAFVAACTAIELDVGDAVLFRPDIVPHAVGLVKAGSRGVLSVGTVVSEADLDALWAMTDTAIRS
jgi:hypothetical protein